ncbi:copper resistance protein NlpE [Methylocucumis oryzae]|uniref:Lipoprotein n=1 Tax=Methylocucumis oryzae TaxID=1632867 RepID=A0A0F3IFW9_9GAMM|nr:copper resistance protein NlpE [Methylocucumis oryzae]KJV05572.1 hypothetical protein VZ94_17215 [Methylocucumis oryzae]
MFAARNQLKQQLLFILSSALLTASSLALAVSDMEMQERMLKAREKTTMQHEEHSAHMNSANKEQEEFHGVFYGFLPCPDGCNGIKTTLSLKQKNIYLLVTQEAKDSSREFFEKGKYTWDDENKIVILMPRKDGVAKKLHIEDDGTLIQLGNDGTRITTDADRYILRRSDTVKSRQVHIH